MVKTDTDFSKLFKEPDVQTYIMIARYIPSYMGQYPHPFMKRYNVRDPFSMENEMRPDLINLEADPFVRDITITKVYKEHRDIHR